MATIAEQKAALICWMRFDDESDPYKDEVGNLTWKTYNTVEVAETNAYIGKAAQFTGSNFMYSSTFDLGGQDFTIDCWYHMLSTSGNWGVLFYDTKTACCANRNYYNAFSHLSFTYGNICPTVEYISLNEIHHAAWVYTHADKTVRIFADGKLGQTNSANTANFQTRSSSQIYLGSYPNGQYPGRGAVDELRIFDGLALWTEDFTPPTATDYDLIPKLLVGAKLVTV